MEPIYLHQTTNFLSKKIPKDPTPSIPTPSTSVDLCHLSNVFIDTKTGIYYYYDRSKNEWIPISNPTSSSILYNLASIPFVVTSEVYSEIALFPWSTSLYSTFTQASIILNVVIFSTPLLLKVTDSNANILLSQQTINTTDTYQYSLILPNSNTTIIIQVASTTNTSIDTSPHINGISIELYN